MQTEPSPYTRLTRNTAGVSTYSSLWLGHDHLLVVTSTGFSETYSRIMLSDIKALFVTATSRHLWWGAPWAVIALVSAIRAIMVFVGHDVPVFSGFFLVVSAGALALNVAWGAGCRVHVMTGVQNTVLPSLVRIKKTRAVLEQLQPLIIAAQANRAVAAAGQTPPPPSVSAAPLPPETTSPAQPS